MSECGEDNSRREKSGKPRSSSSRSRPPMLPRATPQEEGRRSSTGSMKEILDTIVPPPPPPGDAPQMPKYPRPKTRMSPNRPRVPSWLQDRDDENTTKEDQDKQKAKYMVEAIRAVLRETQAMKSLTRYLFERLGEIFTHGKRAPDADDVRHIIVMAWIEELLRFLVIKVMSNDVLSPCKLGSTPPIDIAWMGLTQMPSVYGKICRKLGVRSGVIENDLYVYEDDENNSLPRALKRFSVTLRAYRRCFDQAPPDLYWPEPREAVESEDFLAMVNRNVGSINVSEFVPEAIIQAVPEAIKKVPEAIMKEYDPQTFYEKTTKMIQNGCVHVEHIEK